MNLLLRYLRFRRWKMNKYWLRKNNSTNNLKYFKIFVQNIHKILTFISIIACQNNDDLGASIGLENDDDLFLWNILFEGPEDTLYEGGYFKATMKFPQDYPNSPPEMVFKTKMWHPNIYDDGKVCISILHAPGVDEMNAQETAEERWRPILSAESVLLSVISMLNDPNIESPANLDASI